MEVLNYRKVTGNGPTMAFITFRLPEEGLNLANCRLIRMKNGGWFISYPSQKYKTDEGTKYAPYFWYDKSDKFQRAARTAIEEYVKKHAA